MHPSTKPALGAIFWALELPYVNTFLGDLLLKGNHYEIKVYTFFSLVTSKPSLHGTAEQEPPHPVSTVSPSCRVIPYPFCQGTYPETPTSLN